MYKYWNCKLLIQGEDTRQQFTGLKNDLGEDFRVEQNVSIADALVAFAEQIRKAEAAFKITGLCILEVSIESWETSQ